MGDARASTMTFLEAHRILATFEGGSSLPFLLAMSGTAEPLDLYVRAAAALQGRCAMMRSLPFNTLSQALLSDVDSREAEVFLLMPWDFVPAADWRSGLPLTRQNVEDLRRAAHETADRLLGRQPRGLVYVPARLPPVLSNPTDNASLAHWLLGLATSVNARVLPADAFSLAMYLATGCPFGGTGLGCAADAVVELALRPATGGSKVLVTDLDNVLWNGVIAEDGMDGIAFAPEGRGYRHFIFQTLLAKLRREGVLLCAVSRNDPESATEPLRSGRMPLQEHDFVAIIASYQAKSAQIEQLARQLDLGIDTFVFVDDNPVELAEVSLRLPDVRCIPFPNRDDAIPDLCEEVARLFAKREVTPEDAARTDFYRRRFAAAVPSHATGADLTRFLQSLEMKLTIQDRTDGDRTRALQLINKTNQFNLNGRRITDEDATRTLALGGRLYCASLADRHGSHGEILACLIARDGTITSFVMSCRVLQRRVEQAFLTWLASQPEPPRRLDFTPTARNTPFKALLADPAFGPASEGPVSFDAARYAAAHASDVALFSVQGPADVSRSV